APSLFLSTGSATDSFEQIFGNRTDRRRDENILYPPSIQYAGLHLQYSDERETVQIFRSFDLESGFCRSNRCGSPDRLLFSTTSRSETGPIKIVYGSSPTRPA